MHLQCRKSFPSNILGLQATANNGGNATLRWKKNVFRKSSTSLRNASWPKQSCRPSMVYKGHSRAHSADACWNVGCSALLCCLEMWRHCCFGFWINVEMNFWILGRSWVISYIRICFRSTFHHKFIAWLLKHYCEICFSNSCPCVLCWLQPLWCCQCQCIRFHFHQTNGLAKSWPGTTKFRNDEMISVMLL